MDNFLHGVFFVAFTHVLLLWGIPSDFRNGFTFRDAAGLWKGEECHEESAYHEGGQGKGTACMQAVGVTRGVWCDVGLGKKKSPKFRWGLI